MMLLFLLLILIPLVAHKLAKRYKSRKLWAVTLSCFGAIVCPLGFGIYGLGIIPYLGLVFIGVALFIFSWHSPVGYEIAIAAGIQEPKVVVSGLSHVWIDIINGIVWGISSGAIGYLIDWLRNGQSARIPAK
ncbi:MAG: hypothetical protein ACLQGU_04620 [bacterium]